MPEYFTFEEEEKFDLLIDTLQKYGLEVTDTSIVNPPELEEVIKKGG